ncbi:MAG: GIY-YIG nuclease family protein [Bacteroidota bacterium]
MYLVYAIKSLERNYIYVGLTDNLNRRLSQHNSGKSKTTRPYRPFMLLYSEQFNTRPEARKKEIYLKSGVGKEFLKSLD